ncbi:MAG: beta-galactosidase trimerization domain-containing protein, partial [Oscillospiraceae bacterium]
MHNELKWYEKPMIIADFIPPDPARYDKLNVDEQYNIRKDLGFNAEHLEVHDIAVGESGVVFYPSEFAEESREDILGKVMQIYDKDKLRVIVYFNVHWLAQSLLNKHSDWAQRDVNLEIIDNSYGVGGYSCVNSAFQDYAMGVIKTLGAYKIDGIFLDGPFVYEKGCYCDKCRKLFKEQFGYDAPSEVSMGTQSGEDWFLFKSKSISDFMQKAQQTLKSVNPTAIIYMNSPQLTSTLLCSRDNRRNARYQDMLLAEGGFLYENLRDVPIWKPAATAMLLECQADTKPYCVAIAGRHGPWSRYLLSAEETRLAHFFAVAHGAWTWYGIYMDNNTDAMMHTVKEINTFLQDNSAYYTKTKSAAKIALLWSTVTANHFQPEGEMTDFTRKSQSTDKSNHSDVKQALNGWFDVLSRSTQLFDIIDETALENGQLNNYKLLIMPCAACLSEKGEKNILDFASKGGNVIATCDSGFYDTFGKPKARCGLLPMFGVEKVLEMRTNPREHITVPSGKAGVFKGIEQVQLPSAHIGVQCCAQKSAACYGRYRQLQPARYCELPLETSAPYVIENNYGEGKCIYFTANVDDFYFKYNLPEYATLMNNAVNSLLQPQVSLAIHEGVNSVHASLRYQDDKCILHLINYTASMTRPITAIVPLTNVSVTLHGWAKSHSNVPVVRAIAEEKFLNAVYNGDDLHIIVPLLGDYE